MDDKRIIPQFKPSIDIEAALSKIEAVFRSGYITEGPLAAQLTTQLLEMIGAKYGFYAPNGTLAIALGLLGLDIGEGDEVLVPDVTFIATANALKLVGASPRPVDIVAPNNPTIDLDKVVLNENTKALMIAPLFGTAPTNLEDIIDFCEQHNLLLLEDAAQCIGIHGESGHLGSFGKFGTFSFYADKTITTGEGGFLVTSDAQLADRITLLRNQGRRNSGTFIHESIGYNFRITDMQAALGLTQLSNLEQVKQDKQRIAQTYQQSLQSAVDVGDVQFLSIRQDFTYIPFRVVIFSEKCDQIMRTMEQCGIQGRAMFHPIHRQPGYQDEIWSKEAYPVADQCAATGICLPTWVNLPDEDIAYVADAIKHSLR